ncbi:MAG TPA: hypothetical protein PK747_00880 [Acidobacteriota bacterium]|nr:hypothetical protein [Acidobacteriota bacterium]HNT16570.1 hypothetical protein [Acidobacteriota bacterium]HPA26805.1 hypothetical protein [Acidobacteriota bacterium]HQO19053.1 hypothetical protein [Acidobacteriota bacterium]HQQ45946.1 hypothetical protein [Acidobacteriota bacterium]
MAEIKGTTIQSRLEHIRDNYGREKESEAVSLLKKKFGNDAGGIILPMSWYALAMDDSLCLYIKELSGLPGESAYQELGRRSAASHMKFFKVALGAAKTPCEVIEKMPILHKSYVRGFGEMIVSESSPNHSILKISGHRETFRSVCSSNVAYIAEMCGLIAGVKVRGSEPRCLCRRDTCCEYRFEW